MQALVAASLADRIVTVGPAELAGVLSPDVLPLQGGALQPVGGATEGGKRLARVAQASGRTSGPPRLLRAVPPQTWVGVDEAGRGPLAGPVVACAIALADPPPPGLADSKELSPAKRLQLARTLLSASSRVAVAIGSHAVIDRLNIHRATMAAMARAVGALEGPFDCVWVDGPHRLELPPGMHQHAAVDADALVACVAAASIVAKVVRDRIMEALDALYPGYAFARHKGYPTPDHRQALARLGPSPIHRRSFVVARGRAHPL